MWERILFRVSVGHVLILFRWLFLWPLCRHLNWEFKEFLEMGMGEGFLRVCVGLLVLFLIGNQNFHLLGQNVIHVFIASLCCRGR